MQVVQRKEEKETAHNIYRFPFYIINTTTFHACLIRMLKETFGEKCYTGNF